MCTFVHIWRSEKLRKVAILALFALFISNVAVYLLKPLIAEPRPFLVLANVHQLVPETEIYPFPSGHTTSSFAAATVIGLKYSLKLKNKKFKLIYPLISFAAVIGFSRIYLGVHYPLDILFGALIGITCALTMLKLEERIFQNKYFKEIGLEKMTNIDTAKMIKKNLQKLEK